VQENNAKDEHRSPLYTRKDAEASLRYFQAVAYDAPIQLGGSLSCTFIRSGHILGAAFVVLSDGKTTLTFSGDLGRPYDEVMKSPPYLKHTNYLVLESTYGDRLHDAGDPIKQLGDIINQTIAKGGKIIIPTFAVGRAQKILYYLHQLKQEQVIPDIPIYLDSPMAIKVTDLYCEFPDEHKLEVAACKDIFSIAKYIHTADESRHIDKMKGSSIIIAGSGMADGGRVVDHLKHFISDAKNTVVFVGYQAEETRGRDLVSGVKKVEIDEREYQVRAKIKQLDMLSAHADYNEILEWLSHFTDSPKKIFLTHGELKPAESLLKKIEGRFGWSVVIPKYGESFELN
jgi:metallo-beta-lactamase family protein